MCYYAWLQLLLLTSQHIWVPALFWMLWTAFSLSWLLFVLFLLCPCRHTHACGGQRSASGGHSSALYLGFWDSMSPWPDTHQVCHAGWPASSRNCTTSPQLWGYRHCHHTSFLCGFWGLDTGSLVCHKYLIPSFIFLCNQCLTGAVEEALATAIPGLCWGQGFPFPLSLSKRWWTLPSIHIFFIFILLRD